jgi:beta-glucanase (GH16 family)
MASPRRTTFFAQCGWLVTTLAAAACSHDAAPTPPPPVAPDPDAATPDAAGVNGAERAGWRLVWSDEFDGPADGAPDATKWKYMIGPNNANRELQYYRRENAVLDGGGNLVITARSEPFMNQAYTSARMNTAGVFQQTYGRFETRAKLPAGQGFWPAFWLLGGNIGQVGWPTCGEIDILENIGREPTTNHGSLHGPGYSGGGALTAPYRLTGGATFTADFHVFAVEWEENVVRFYVDDRLYLTRTPSDLGTRQWVFDHPFYLILNVAVGGTFPGAPNATTVFPQTLVVDYVRVYAR